MPLLPRQLLFSVFLLLLPVAALKAQCVTGQTPASAFPICGFTKLQMATVPACNGKKMVVPGCDNDGAAYADLNAFWYKFTCYTAGSLALLIEPVSPTDDYDWQLFDVTGVTNLDDVYTNKALVVTGNWAGTYGNTGAAAGGVSHIECASSPPANMPTFSAMPNLVVGHQYLLMISHYTVTNQSGYTLSFDGGTASVTDPNLPHLQQGNYYCPTKTIRIKLNKDVKCSSLATDGSDFTLNIPGTSVVSAAGINCSNGFDMDSLVLGLSGQLPPGNYSVSIKKGKDANTLLDYCDRDIPEGEHIDFTVDAPALVYIDSLAPLPCAPDSIQIVFTLPIDCATVAPDGSDFVITGPGAVQVTGARGNCAINNADNTITLYLNKRITTGGTYQISIVTGSDGNSVATECGSYILAGDNTISFTLAQQTPALLSQVLPVSCRTEKISVVLSKPVQCNSIAADGSDFSITGPLTIGITRAVFACRNNFADTIDLYFNQPILREGNYTVRVKAGNDGNTLLTDCWQETPAGNNRGFSTKDTVSASFTYDLFLHCETDTVALFHDGAHGVNAWTWYFDGQDSIKQQNPIKTYHQFGIKNITLVVSNGVCSDTASEQIFLSNVLEAGFQLVSDTLCPGDAAAFINKSIGNIAGQQWTFGNGNTSTLYTPPVQAYAVPVRRDQLYYVQLVVRSNMNCFDTAIQVLHVLNSCFIAVPTGFTPNGDGINDYLYPLNNFKMSRMDFKVYNRLGQLVFHTTDPAKKWDGRFNNEPQPPGTFVWMLDYTDKDKGQHIFQKGTSVLIR